MTSLSFKGVRERQALMSRFFPLVLSRSGSVKTSCSSALASGVAGAMAACACCLSFGFLFSLSLPNPLARSRETEGGTIRLTASAISHQQHFPHSIHRRVWPRMTDISLYWTRAVFFAFCTLRPSAARFADIDSLDFTVTPRAFLR